ncbi:MAG TPA: hypothetical protein DCG72_11195 [Gammaproteobacteria bacterium]|nr:hypothetical protein [Gammaproteobacteria bacterium]
MLFSLTDAGMTACYGWLVTTSMFMKPLYFGALGGLSFTLAFLPVVAAALFGVGTVSRGVRRWFFNSLALLVVIIYAGGFGANFVSNYGLSSAVFEGNITQANNANLLFSDARSKVERLRKRDLELTSQINFKPKVGGGVWLAPEAYDKLASAAQLIRDNEAKRGGCGPICEQKTQELVDIQAAKENAIARQAAIAERKQIRSELKEAEEQAAKKPEQISVAAAQVNALATLFTQSLDPEKSTKDWTLIYVAVAISLAISVFAHLCNLVVALNLAKVEDEPESQHARNGWLPDARAAEGRPVPAGTSVQDGQQQVYVLQSETIRENGSSNIQHQALLNTLKRLDERFNPKGATG